MFINSYLENRWHRTKINSSYSTWKELLEGIPQGSVLGPLLFNIYFNDLFFILDESEAINYADDTNLYACDMDLGNLIRRLEHDALIAIEWFECNYMKLNNDKCHFIFSGYKHEHLWVNVGDSKIWESKAQKILGVNFDCKLKFVEHVEGIIATAGRKLTALARMSHILTFSKMRLLIKSFVESQFSYCPLIWMFSSRYLNNKINKLQERALRILYKDYEASFEDLLERDDSETIHNRNIKTLAKEVYKVENDILPNALGSLITKRDLQYDLRHASTFLRDRVNTVSYGSESIRILGPKIWNLLPNDIKYSETFDSFQAKIRNWKVDICPCRLCKTYIQGVGFL